MSAVWPAAGEALTKVLSSALTTATAALGAALAAMPSVAQTGEEVPFITTPDRVTLAMLQLAGTGPRDRVLDLGSGDGRIVITAARRFGASGLGVEIDPALVARSLDNARAAGVADRARFLQQDLFTTDLAQASVITMYLLPEVNLALRPKLLALAPGTRIVSHDWDMDDWAPDRTLTLVVPEKTIGREKLSRVHLWTVPARVAGRWCGPGGRVLELQQRHQQVEGRLGGPGDTSRLTGHLQGAALRLLVGATSLTWQAEGEHLLRVGAASGDWASWQGLAFRRAAATGTSGAAGSTAATGSTGSTGRTGTPGAAGTDQPPCPAD